MKFFGEINLFKIVIYTFNKKMFRICLVEISTIGMLEMCTYFVVTRE